MAISSYDVLLYGALLKPGYLESVSRGFGSKPNQFTHKPTLRVLLYEGLRAVRPPYRVL